MKILLTGAAGFIGMHVCDKLLRRGDSVIGIDNLNNYYDVKLKKSRLKKLQNHKKFTFIKTDIIDGKKISKIFTKYKPKKVIHLAAQAGVRYSIKNPNAYVKSNLLGFTNILEASRNNKIEHLVFASSSSVYGGNTKLPFSEKDNIDHPVSFYAATKKANELMAHTYSHLYNLPITGLRFFTVYGPWGRPDMALFLFTKSILKNKAINIFNYGNMIRDFTFIDDIVSGVIATCDKIAFPSKKFNSTKPIPHISNSPYRIFNIGNNQPVKLMNFIKSLEKVLGKKAKKRFLPLQQGDVPKTYADTKELYKWVKFKPSTLIDDGIKSFVKWYKSYYKF